MNEIDFIRQQLATERAHFREILQAVRLLALLEAWSEPLDAAARTAVGLT